MKKPITLIICAMLLIVLLALVTGCAERVSDEDSYKVSFSSTDAELTPNAFEERFPVSGFDSKSQNDLLQEHVCAIYYNDRMMESALDTPIFIYIKTGKDPVLQSYNKCTGEFFSACRDPLCTHDDCLWGNTGKNIYCGNSGLFFIVYNEECSTIYQTDFFGSDIKILYQSNDVLSHIVQEGQNIYFLEEGKDENSDKIVGRIVRLHLKDRSYDIMLSKEGLYYFMPLQEKILYLEGDTMSATYRLFDPATGKEDVYASSDILPIALYKDVLYFRNGNSLCRRTNCGLGDEEVLLQDVQITDLLFNGESIYFMDNQNTLYKADSDFAKIEEVYSALTESRISNVIVDQNLLFYTYSTGNGASRNRFFVFVDLETGETLEVKKH